MKYMSQEPSWKQGVNANDAMSHYGPPVRVRILDQWDFSHMGLGKRKRSSVIRSQFPCSWQATINHNLTAFRATPCRMSSPDVFVIFLNRLWWMQR